MKFRIKMIKPVKITDITGKVIQEIKVGDIREATHDAGHYYVSCPDIYKDEAIRLPDLIDERWIELSNTD